MKEVHVPLLYTDNLEALKLLKEKLDFMFIETHSDTEFRIISENHVLKEEADYYESNCKSKLETNPEYTKEMYDSDYEVLVKSRRDDISDSNKFYNLVYVIPNSEKWELYDHHYSNLTWMATGVIEGLNLVYKFKEVFKLPGVQHQANILNKIKGILGQEDEPDEYQKLTKD